MDELESEVQELDESGLKSKIWTTWRYVNSRIDLLRRRAWAIAGYLDPPGKRRFRVFKRRWQEHRGDIKDGVDQLNLGKEPERTEYDDTITWVIAMQKWATRKPDPPPELNLGASPEFLVSRTRNAGRILGGTERVMGLYYELVNEDSQNPNAPPRNRAERWNILTRSLTMVYTARDHLSAGIGNKRNLLAKIGNREVRVLCVLLFVLSAIYVCFHPISGWRPIDSTLRPLYEVFFWSLFGGIAMSVVTVILDTRRERFDPRYRFTYIYRIPLAPFFAYVALLLLSVMGVVITQGDGSIINLGLDPNDPNYLFLVLIAFLLGFFSKKVLSLLEYGWRMIIPAPDVKSAESVQDEDFWVRDFEQT